MPREQGDTKIDLRSMTIIMGSIKKIILGAGRIGSTFKGSQELETLPYGVSFILVCKNPVYEAEGLITARVTVCTMFTHFLGTTYSHGGYH